MAGLKRDPEELKNLTLQPRHAKRLKAYRQKAIEELRRTQAPFVASMPRPSTLK